MARVISWVVRDKYAYLGTEQDNYMPILSDTKIQDSEINKLAGYWRDKELEVYSLAYKKLYDAVNGDFTNLKSPKESGASIYFNVLENDGVIIITGKDANQDNNEEAAEYYNLHMLNQNVSIGLGDDYRLDVPISAETEFYIEHNGIIRNSLVKNVTLKNESLGETIEYFIDEINETVHVILSLPSGIEFSGDTHILKYELDVQVGDESPVVLKTYFSLTGVKGGEEGSFYNLVVSPKIIKKKGNDYSTNEVNVFCVKNGILCTDALWVKYGEQWTTSALTFRSEEIDYSGGTVNFELYFDKTSYPIDSETCTIVKDGENGESFVQVELSNEMDGVSLGGDNVLNTTIITGSGARLLSGNSEANISQVVIRGFSENYPLVHCRVQDGDFVGTEDGVWTFNGSYGKNVEFNIKFESGFTFNTDFREPVYVELTGTFNGQSVSASTNYVIIGLKGGKDGETFRLLTSVDSLFFDPNSGRYSKDFISCSAFTGVNEISGIPYEIGYTENFAYSTYSECIVSGKYEVGNIYSFPSEEESAFNISSVTFYLFYKESEDLAYLLDRETVPVITQGINGSDRIYLDIGNEISSIGVGADEMLDVQTIVDTEFYLFSGASKTIFNKVEIITEDDSFNGFYCRIYNDVEPTTFEKEGTFTETGITFNNVPGSAGTGHIEITLESGLTFNSLESKVLTISVSQGDIVCSALYKIMPVKNGKDGVSYSVVPSESQIILDENKNNYIYPERLTATAYNGVEKIENNEKFRVKYTVNEIKTNIDETWDIPTDGIDIRSIIETLERIYFYLFYKQNGTWIIVDRESVPLVKNGLNGQSSYYLDLDNENATVNCDSAGTIYHEAILPECEASFYIGTKRITENVFYTIEGSCGYTGITTSVTNGNLVISCEHSEIPSEEFNIESDKLILTISAEYNSAVIVSKFTITKSYPGQDGVPATSYWLAPSLNAIKIPSGETGNITITCDKYVQVGENTPSANSFNNVYIEYWFDNETHSSFTSTSQFSMTSGYTVIKNYSNFYLKLVDSNNKQYDLESIPILKDGEKGDDGCVYSLVPSTNMVKVNRDGSIVPSAVTCSAFQKIGENEATQWVLPEGYKKFLYRVDDEQIEHDYTDGTPISVSSEMSTIRFYVKNSGGTENGKIYQMETVLIEKDPDGIYSLHLNNPNMAVTCDGTGAIDPNAPKPHCTPTLMYDNEPSEEHYSIDIEESLQDRHGVKINQYGVIILDDITDFDDTFSLTIQAILDDTQDVIATSVVNIYKVKQGGEGKRGISVRRSLWEPGKIYYGEVGDIDNPNNYLDVVCNENMFIIGDSGVSFYKCLSSHTSTNLEADILGGYWTGLTSQEPFVTPLMLADVIDARYISVSSLTVNLLQSTTVVPVSAYSGNNTVVEYKEVGLNVENGEIYIHDENGNNRIYIHDGMLSNKTGAPITTVNYYIPNNALNYTEKGSASASFSMKRNIGTVDFDIVNYTYSATVYTVNEVVTYSCVYTGSRQSHILSVRHSIILGNKVLTTEQEDVTATVGTGGFLEFNSDIAFGVNNYSIDSSNFSSGTYTLTYKVEFFLNYGDQYNYSNIKVSASNGNSSQLITIYKRKATQLAESTIEIARDGIRLWQDSSNYALISGKYSNIAGNVGFEVYSGTWAFRVNNNTGVQIGTKSGSSWQWKGIATTT